jgi:hypothetical protein
MPYSVYENWQAEGHKARVHAADCSYCNDGERVHPGSSDRNGKSPRAICQSAALDHAQGTQGHVSR